MSDAIFEAKCGGLSLKNDALRDAFALDGVRCFLLKRGENKSLFTKIVEITAGFRVKDGVFTWADTEIEDVRDDWTAATHIAYGVPNEDDEIEVYGMEEKTTVDPDGSDVYWRCDLDRLENERYEITP